MNLKTILLTTILCPLSVWGQHQFEYVAETAACAFYMDALKPQKTDSGYVVWEKRYLLASPQGEIERDRLADTYGGAIKNARYYYVKQLYDSLGGRTSTLAVYFFDDNDDEVGYRKFASPIWYKPEPQTIGAMEIDFINKVLARPQKEEDYQLQEGVLE